MSEKDIPLGEFIEDLTPFHEWLSKLTPAEQERARDDLNDLNYLNELGDLGVPDAEALVRADFHSPWAEVTRIKSFGYARRNALRMWELDPNGQDLVTQFIDGKSVWRCGDMSRAVRMMHDAGLSKEGISEIGRLIAKFAVFTAMYHLDTGNIHGYQNATEFVMMEFRNGRATGKQASGGKWDEPPSSPIYGPGNPFPCPADPEGDDT
jgi:hypothetical protein